MKLEEQLVQVRDLNLRAMEEARSRWNQIAKPLHSLGVLEDMVIKIAGITENSQIQIDKKALVILCADNGVVTEGVTQTGAEVTAVVTENFTKGETCVCIMAERAGVDIFPVDIGVSRDLEHCGDRYPLQSYKIAYGTANMLREPAMTEREVREAIDVGIYLVEKLKKEGYQLIATGEMGIGNTTTSSAVASVLLGMEPERLTGRGAGLSAAGLAKKIRVIKEAILLHKPDWKDGLDVLAKVGGLDLAGLTGIYLGGAIYRVPIVIDGFISATAALLATTLCPEVTSYMLASHVSAEPAGQLILERLKQQAVVHANLCLGEGTGAMTMIPMLSMAVEVYHKMSTFQEITIDPYQPL
ncbi:MAG: nicotinate-nucleotide--dimethylbenzimidazole phosphoribosyltransferase [Hungatella sp.]